MLERTYFFGLPLAGAGTPQVESLRSYVQRLAFAHCVKPRALFETLLERFPGEGPPTDLHWLSKYWGIHGGGEVTAKLVERFERATGSNLRGSTFSALAQLLACQHLTKRGAGRYCPLCVQEDGAHGQLLWETACVNACPVHRVKLRDSAACGAPKELRLGVNRRPKVPYACSSCGSLGFKCIAESPVAASDAEVWVATQVGRLLALQSEPGQWTAESLQTGIRAVVDGAFQGSVVSASKSAGLSRGSVCVWAAGKIRPNLAGLMELCYCAQADVVELFRGRFRRASVPDVRAVQESITSSLAACDEEALQSSPSVVDQPADLVTAGCANESQEQVERPKETSLEKRPRPVKLYERTYNPRPGRHHLASALEAAAFESPPPSLTELAKRLRADRRFLSQQCPEETAALRELGARHRERQWQSTLDATIATFERCAEELKSRGVPVTYKYLQAVSGLVTYRQNRTRARAMELVLSRYAQPRGHKAPPDQPAVPGPAS